MTYIVQSTFQHAKSFWFFAPAFSIKIFLGFTWVPAPKHTLSLSLSHPISLCLSLFPSLPLSLSLSLSLCFKKCNPLVLFHFHAPMENYLLLIPTKNFKKSFCSQSKLIGIFFKNIYLLFFIHTCTWSY